MKNFLGLTAREETFARHYAQTRDPGAAYRAAYDCAGKTPSGVNAAGQRVARNAHIQARVKEIVALATEDVAFGVKEALKAFLAIAQADPNELIALKVGCCRYCHGEGHGYQWREREYLAELDRVEKANNLGGGGPPLPLPDYAGGFGFDATLEPHEDCPECRGEGEARIVAKDSESLSPAGRLLYGGVKHTREGPQIIMADRMKALELAVRMLGGFDDKISLTAKAATVALTTADPHEASRAYQQMITGS